MSNFDWKKIIDHAQTSEAVGQDAAQPPVPQATGPAPSNPELDELLRKLAADGTPAPAHSKFGEELPFAEHERLLEAAGKSGVLPKVNPFALEMDQSEDGMPVVQRPEDLGPAPRPPEELFVPTTPAPVGPPPLETPDGVPAAFSFADKVPVGPPPLDSCATAEGLGQDQSEPKSDEINPPISFEPPIFAPPPVAKAESEGDSETAPVAQSDGEQWAEPPTVNEDGSPVSVPVDDEKAKVMALFTKKAAPVPAPLKAPTTQEDLSRLNSADANATTFDAHKPQVHELSKYEGGAEIADIHIDEILRMAVERRASDIHFTTGLPPMVRVDGEMGPLPFQSLKPADVRRLLYDTLDDDKLQKFEKSHELDFSYPVRGVGRFRVNVFMQRGSVAGVMRSIPQRIPAFDELLLPPVIREMCKRTSGLVLVTGPTGSGKSTTIASMIDDINNRLKGHIVTIEDPIEYLHGHKQCIVNQRELHSDTFSFHNALRALLREDPDIILVGELRDLETIEAALTLAETGHLVFGTLHTRNAPATIDRIIDVFPPESQEQIRVLLANTVEGVVCQQLLPRLGGGRRAAIEIMLGTPAIKNLIREGKTHQMQSVLETGGSIGMQTMDASLAELYRTGQCQYDECLVRAIDKESFGRLARAA